MNRRQAAALRGYGLGNVVQMRRTGLAALDGTSVTDYQTWLHNAGFLLPVDGVAGPQTASAVRAVQQALGVTVDGIWGPQTEAAWVADAAASFGKIRTVRDAWNATYGTPGQNQPAYAPTLTPAPEEAPLVTLPAPAPGTVATVADQPVQIGPGILARPQDLPSAGGGVLDKIKALAANKTALVVAGVLVVGLVLYQSAQGGRAFPSSRRALTAPEPGVSGYRTRRTRQRRRGGRRTRRRR